MKDTKKMVLLAILTSVAVCLSLIDKTITPLAFPVLPTAKIGLANIIVLIAIYNFNFKETLTLVIIKILIANLIFGSLTSLIIGGSASLLSFLSMYGLQRISNKYVSGIGISVLGGFLHIIVQLFVTMLIYQLGDVVMYFGAILVFISLISSILIGIIVNRLKAYLDKQNIK
jgi:heptaprenyl diphosphate synthase